MRQIRASIIGRAAGILTIKEGPFRENFVAENSRNGFWRTIVQLGSRITTNQALRLLFTRLVAKELPADRELASSPTLESTARAWFANQPDIDPTNGRHLHLAGLPAEVRSPAKRAKTSIQAGGDLVDLEKVSTVCWVPRLRLLAGLTSPRNAGVLFQQLAGSDCPRSA